MSWITLTLTVLTLQSLGFGCEGSGNERQMLASVEDKVYDLIFMDCEMSGTDGFEATRRLRRLERERGIEPTTVIALTGHATKGDRERCRDAGMSDLISKPVSGDLLEAKLHQWLSHPVSAAALESSPAER